MNVANVIQNTPFFGRMFSVEESSGLSEINTWPGLMVMTSFVWLFVAGLLGLLMPATQILDLGGVSTYNTALTAHGALLAFPFTFQLMVGVSLHRIGGCVGKPVAGAFTKLIYGSMNVGAILFTAAVLLGLKISYAVMWPLPIVGVENGQWSMGLVVLGFTGLSLVLMSVIVFYPVQILKMQFFGKEREDLLLSKRSFSDPGMLGMVLAVIVLLVAGTPLVIVASVVLLGMYGIVPMEAVSWATEPVVFQFVFFIFAHNLMEAMAIMVISAIYATLPLYLADGTRELFSRRIANLALWILLGTSITTFFHHFFTMFPALPAALAYHGNIMSWGTGIGAALSIFTILATIWQHGLKPEPGLMILLAGFALYILDGISAMVTSNIAWSFVLHGTMWASGHTMSILIAISMMWMGVLYHHYPVITGRKLSRTLGYWFIGLYVTGAIGVSYSFLAAGAAGMPRRFPAWDQDGWLIYGQLILFFGLVLGAAFVVFAYNLLKSREITTSPGNRTVAVDGTVAAATE